MITRKAAMGFLLLAVLIFPVAYMSWVAPASAIDKSAIKLNMDDYKVNEHSDTGKIIYHTPKIVFNTPLEMAGIVTGVIEGFTLLCYLGLKKIEPWVISLEESERARVRKKVE